MDQASLRHPMYWKPARCPALFVEFRSWWNRLGCWRGPKQGKMQQKMSTGCDRVQKQGRDPTRNSIVITLGYINQPPSTSWYQYVIAPRLADATPNHPGVSPNFKPNSCGFLRHRLLGLCLLLGRRWLNWRLRLPLGRDLRLALRPSRPGAGRESRGWGPTLRVPCRVVCSRRHGGGRIVSLQLLRVALVLRVCPGR